MFAGFIKLNARRYFSKRYFIMRKQVFGRRFKRDKNERKGLFKSLMSSLVLKEGIKTTEEKAKAIKGQVEKLVTKANKNGTEIKNDLQKYLTPEAVDKLIREVAPRFKQRSGGYTRIIKLGRRVSDNAKVALIEWVEKGSQISKIKDQKQKGDKKKNREKIQEEKKTETKKGEKKETKAKTIKKEKKK